MGDEVPLQSADGGGSGEGECIWQKRLDLHNMGSASNPVRRVFRLADRTIEKQGVMLLLPEYVLDDWTTTLVSKSNPDEIISMYYDHATHEQFAKTPSQHSAFKTDMDLE